MAKLLFGSIDLNKIDKTKVITKDKNGNPFKNGAKYLNIAVWVNDEVDQYGNKASIQVSQSKAEREAKSKATYIGNLKEFDKGNSGTNNANEEENDDFPFN